MQVCDFCGEEYADAVPEYVGVQAKRKVIKKPVSKNETVRAMNVQRILDEQVEEEEIYENQKTEQNIQELEKEKVVLHQFFKELDELKRQQHSGPITRSQTRIEAEILEKLKQANNEEDFLNLLRKGISLSLISKSYTDSLQIGNDESVNGEICFFKAGVGVKEDVYSELTDEQKQAVIEKHCSSLNVGSVITKTTAWFTFLSVLNFPLSPVYGFAYELTHRFKETVGYKGINYAIELIGSLVGFVWNYFHGWLFPVAEETTVRSVLGQIAAPFVNLGSAISGIAVQGIVRQQVDAYLELMILLAMAFVCALATTAIFKLGLNKVISFTVAVLVKIWNTVKLPYYAGQWMYRTLRSKMNKNFARRLQEEAKKMKMSKDESVQLQGNFILEVTRRDGQASAFATAIDKVNKKYEDIAPKN